MIGRCSMEVFIDPVVNKENMVISAEIPEKCQVPFLHFRAIALAHVYPRPSQDEQPATTTELKTAADCYKAIFLNLTLKEQSLVTFQKAVFIDDDSNKKVESNNTQQNEILAKIATANETKDDKLELKSRKNLKSKEIGCASNKEVGGDDDDEGGDEIDEDDKEVNRELVDGVINVDSSEDDDFCGDDDN
ncbi:unnamed protein product [Trichobilharzia regenti]|nr:unnamed protein product [Trichobilharzia regenti]